MAKQVQFRRGTTSQHSSFTGATGEITVDTDKDVAVIHDGSTAGGFPLSKQTSVDAKAPIDDPTFTTGITSPQVDITAQGDLRLQDSAGGQYVALQAPATISSNYTLTMPTADGSANQVLRTDGSGVLSFADAGGGGAFVKQSTTSITVNATASVEFTFATGSNILAHRFVFNRITGTANGYEYIAQFRNQSTSTYITSAFVYSYHFYSGVGGSSSAAANSDGNHEGIRLNLNAGNAGTDANYGLLNGYIDIFNPYDSKYQLALYQFVETSNTGEPRVSLGGGQLDQNQSVATPVDRVRFKPEGSGTFADSGSITYYTLEN